MDVHPSLSVSPRAAGMSYAIQQRLRVLERRRTILHVSRKLNGLDCLGGLNRRPESFRSQQMSRSLVCVSRKFYLFNFSIIAARASICGCSTIPSAANGLEVSLNVSR